MGSTVDEDQRFASRRVRLYYQLATLVRVKIVSHEDGPGDRIPAKAKLVEDDGGSGVQIHRA